LISNKIVKNSEKSENDEEKKASGKNRLTLHLSFFKVIYENDIKAPPRR
jgi:hypothetical protein